MNPSGNSSIGREIDRQAAEWFGRREVGLDPEKEREFQRWLAADPRHAEHYREFDETWQLLDGLEELKRRPAGTGRPPRLSHRRWLPAALAAAAAITVALVLWQHRVAGNVNYTIVTEAGGLKKLELPDGSVVRLNADTAVEVKLTAGVRQVNLQRGEAYFAVAKDQRRPFVVSAAGVSVRAVGTAFNVALRPASLEVLVTEGQVRVEEGTRGQSVLPGANPQREQPLLESGHRATLALHPANTGPAQAVVTEVAEPETARALAWQVKMLEFDLQPLDAVVKEFNRYNQHQLVIADPALATRTFGGTFRADNYEAFVELLEDRFGVEARRNGGETVLSVRR
jgi:transmembrane sensor